MMVSSRLNAFGELYRALCVLVTGPTFRAPISALRADARGRDDDSSLEDRERDHILRIQGNRRRDQHRGQSAGHAPHDADARLKKLGISRGDL